MVMSNVRCSFCRLTRRRLCWSNRVVCPNTPNSCAYWALLPLCREIHGDFARLGRIISGNAVGLVLGGGGARGAAHVGVIKSLRQNGVLIDMVGGTSIGSLVGGVLASDPYDQDFLEHKTHFWFSGMGSVWKALMDFTYGYVARFTGSHFNSLLLKDRLAFVSSVRQLEMIKKSSGYRYAEETVPNLVLTNAHLMTLIRHEKFHERLLRSGRVYRPESRNNFHNSIMDIAAQLCRSAFANPTKTLPESKSTNSILTTTVQQHSPEDDEVFETNH